MPKIDDANKYATLFNSTAKILTLIGGAVVSCTVAYYMIIDNAKEIILLKKELKEQILLLEERGNNRFRRGMERGDKMEQYGVRLEERVRELEKENAELKGRYNETH